MVGDWLGTATVTAQGSRSDSTRRARGGDFYLATSGDLYLATSGDFVMATDTLDDGGLRVDARDLGLHLLERALLATIGYDALIRDRLQSWFMRSL